MILPKILPPSLESDGGKCLPFQVLEDFHSLARQDGLPSVAMFQMMEMLSCSLRLTLELIPMDKLVKFTDTVLKVQPQLAELQLVLITP